MANSVATVTPGKPKVTGALTASVISRRTA